MPWERNDNQQSKILQEKEWPCLVEQVEYELRKEMGGHPFLARTEESDEV